MGKVLALLPEPPERLPWEIWPKSIVCLAAGLCSRPCSGAGDPWASYCHQKGRVWTGETLPSVSTCFEKSKT